MLGAGERITAVVLIGPYNYRATKAVANYYSVTEKSKNYARHR